jgi:ankyrin repeat protein
MSNPVKQTSKQTSAPMTAKALKASAQLWDASHEGTLVNKKALQKLLKKGAQLDFATCNECKPQPCAVEHARTVRRHPELAQKGSWTPLMMAVIQNQLVSVRVLLDAGAAVDAKDMGGCTSLYAAASSDYTAIADALLAKGADVESVTDEGCTALYSAAYEGYTRVVDALMAARAKLEATGPGGYTALIIAAEQGRTAIVRALLDSGADARALTLTGQTALFAAASCGHASCVKLLLRGSDVDAVNCNGSTALMIATAQNQHACVRLLMRKGGADASIASPEVHGKTPLELAIAAGIGAATLRELWRVCATCAKTEGQIEGKMLKCGACTKVYYCTSECQRIHWPTHALECKQLAAVAAAEQAKAVAAAAVVPFCLWCSNTSGAGGAALSTCSRCETARYCSRQCQMNDFSRHKEADDCKK